MDVQPKISRYLITVVVTIFLLVGACIYAILVSEKITRFAICTAIDCFVANNECSLKATDVSGCIIDGIEIKKIELRHAKPTFEVNVTDFSLKFSYNALLKDGGICVDGKIGELAILGLWRLPEKVSEVPAFISPLCMVSLPGNIKIKEFEIKSIKFSPLLEKNLTLTSDALKIKSEDNNGKLKVNSVINIDWKNKPLSVVNFDGSYEQNKKKLNGIVEVNFAKQIFVSEVTVASNKKGVEFIGTIASQTVFDVLPLSQWLGYLWQAEYPYSFSGRIFCKGSWLYSSENGFIGNLNGKYEKLKADFVGGALNLLELNGDWKFFNETLTLKDGGSKLLNFPMTIDGKVESVIKGTKKYDLVFNYDSVAVDKLISSIPWVIRYTNKIPAVSGVATISVKINGTRPMISSKFEVKDLQQKDLKLPAKVSGKAFYRLSETGNANVNGKFSAVTEEGLPTFFKRFSNGFYSKSNVSNLPATFTFSVNGILEEKVNFQGQVSQGKNTGVFEASGELLENKFDLNIQTKENQVHTVVGADPIDLLLMR